MVADDLLDASLSELLDMLSGQEPPGAGSAAAIVVAGAACLVTMVARASKEHWPEAGSDVACLAALLVENGNPEVRADAAAAALLAEGGARAAAKLVEINLGATEDDPRVRHVRTLVAVAAEASERALRATQ